MRFYDLTDMTAELQKAMGYTVMGVQNSFCLLEDMIIVSTGFEAEQLKLVNN